MTKPPRTANRALARVKRAVGKGRRCYPAAEVVYHAGGGRRAGLTPMQQNHEGVSHWWVRGPGGEVLDPASAQFRTPVPYEKGRGRGFLTKKPSRRARQLASQAGVKLNPPRGCQIVPLSEDADWDAIEAVTDRDVYEIMEEAEELFRRSGIRVSSVEKLHEACLSPEGKVLGASVVGLETTEPYDWDDEQRPRYVFSIAVLDEARRRGIARGLVESLMEGLPSDEVLLEGKVVNPYMAVLLGSLGFRYHNEWEYEEREDEGEEWTDFDLSQGRPMFRPNPPEGIRVKILDRGHDGFIVRAYLGRRLVGSASVLRSFQHYDVTGSEVVEGQRKQGIGAALYQAAHAEACRRGLPLRSEGYQRSKAATGVWRSMERDGIAQVERTDEWGRLDFIAPCPPAALANPFDLQRKAAGRLLRGDRISYWPNGRVHVEAWIYFGELNVSVNRVPVDYRRIMRAFEAGAPLSFGSNRLFTLSAREVNSIGHWLCPALLVVDEHCPRAPERLRRNPGLLARLDSLRPALAAVANEAIEEHEWHDDGGGGACDLVAQAMAGVLAEHGIDSVEGGHEGDDHAWLIAYDEAEQQAFGVDVHPSVYETGGGYSWRRVQGSSVAPANVDLWPIPYEDIRERFEAWD